MYSLCLTCHSDETDRLSGELWEAGTAGIQEIEMDGHLVELRAGFENSHKSKDLLQQFRNHSPRWCEEPAVDWVEQTHRAWPARSLGQRLFIAPAWSNAATPAGRLRIVHNPGMACGTGEHPCTRLALGALERLIIPGTTIADIGAGSGILAIAARRLGAGTAVAADPDADALRIARENFRLNGLRGDLVAGSAECLAPDAFDLVVANISATVLLSMADDLLAIVRPGGTLILTGFTTAEAKTMNEVFEPCATEELEGWSCLISQPC